MEWKNSPHAPSKSTFEAAVAGLEYVFPPFKHGLPWAHAALHSWATIHTPAHTIPMCIGPALLFGAYISAAGQTRLGAGLILQQKCGLRPSEMLALLARDVVLPGESVSHSHHAVIGLGLRRGTKAKRAQSVLCDDAVVLALLSWLKSNTADDDLLFPYTYENLRRMLSKVSNRLGLDFVFTPHSPRSGFACDLQASGVPFPTIKELGRWVSDQSLRTYLDLVQASNIGVTFRLNRLSNAMNYVIANLLEFFPGAERHLPNTAESAAICNHGPGRVQARRGDLHVAGGSRAAGPSVVDATPETADESGHSGAEDFGRSRGRGRGPPRGSARREGGRDERGGLPGQVHRPIRGRGRARR